jgi:amino acid permease
MRRTLAKLFPAIAALFIIALFALELSALALSAAKAYLGCAIYYTIVRFGHDEIDHIRVWHDNPLYGALLLLGYAAVIAASFAGS